ncbi:hypothetical protein CesoFtcFv8_009652 [Champsocephalus esox]|uniref:Uncharacterized protein n=1 Tax=Champsocephalus esox TaxID=159716 RepID=A0AAN8C7D9_9TELE|nr:hypothetical protein CesoFtcFv8_009652 [Champsocephalus esox]
MTPSRPPRTRPPEWFEVLCVKRTSLSDTPSNRRRPIRSNESNARRCQSRRGPRVREQLLSSPEARLTHIVSDSLLMWPKTNVFVCSLYSSRCRGDRGEAAVGRTRDGDQSLRRTPAEREAMQGPLLSALGSER